MNKEIIIYITADASLCVSDWFTVLVDNLKMALFRAVSPDVQIIVKGEGDEPAQIEKNIKSATLYITVVPSKAESSEEYLTELNFIADYTINSRQVELSECLFKINLSAHTDLNQPATFDAISGYNLFELQGRRNVPVKFDFDKVNSRTIAWNLIIDLAYDLKDGLDNLKNEEAGSEIVKRHVYLANCSPELIPVRDELKREFQHFGFSVLPKANVDFTEYSETIDDLLTECEFVVQMLGSKYGDIPRGDRVSKYEKENLILSEYLQKHQNIHRFIWIPDFFKRKEQRQILYINRVKQKEIGINNEIVESSLDEFKDILVRRMVNGEAFLKEQKTDCSLYIIASQGAALERLGGLASDANVCYNVLDYSNQSTLFHKHVDLLTSSESVMVNWDNGDEAWLKSKLSDLVKAPGMGRKNPFKKVAVLAGKEMPDIASYLNWVPDLKVIEHTDTKEIKKFFEGIIE